ncbi:MAG TPA: 50S ribosomal protein L11 methyltransferase [Flavisolibacter sp.]|nr:50S ribosomal protein L11 methyltransferase [Flavisolibacter sp.]
MSYIQVIIKGDEAEQEVLISRFSDLSIGFEQQQNQLLVYFNNDEFDREEMESSLQDHSFKIEYIPEQNWNTVWESNFQPVMVDSFCAIRADFHQPILSVQHEIIITPKMSFGTGHHATTYMMVQQMEQMYFQDKAVFDFGTGTGILAVLAEKMGAASVEAIDVDEWSIANARENFERNGCQRINVLLSSSLPQQQCDVILANINKNVLLQYHSQLQNKLNQGGRLLLSGLLIEDEADILQVYSAVQLHRREERQGWISLLFVK